ncbi:MAG: archaellin/type IV pilin N-terminal domain-containing protein [Candidatus Hodarchaeales archaeon]
MMKNIIKSKKGISPILATLLLIVIAVSAVIVTYAWVMTFTGSTISQAGAVLSLDNMRFYTNTDDYVEITLRNSGTSDAKVETVYAGTTESNLSSQTIDSYNPTTRIISEGETLTITIQYDWDDGTRYYFNIATEEGISYPFSREA